MNAEARIGTNEMETNSQIAFYAKDKMLEALRKFPEYVRQEEESRYETGEMLPLKRVSIGQDLIEENVTRRGIRANGIVIREREKRIISQNSSEERVSAQIETVESNGVRISGNVSLFIGSQRFEGEEALDLIDSSFPKLFLSSS